MLQELPDDDADADLPSSRFCRPHLYTESYFLVPSSTLTIRPDGAVKHFLQVPEDWQPAGLEQDVAQLTALSVSVQIDLGIADHLE